MDDETLQRFAASGRVSLRAVLVEDREDARDALRQAGIFDAVAVPVVVGEAPDLSGGLLGDGRTSNLTGTLEMDESDGFEDFDAGFAEKEDLDSPSGPDRAASRPDSAGPLPAAPGKQPMAPVRLAGRTRPKPVPAMRNGADNEAPAGPGVPRRFPVRIHRPGS